ncbi:unnamed protein product [Closterium sp. NIES-54]
MCLHMQETVSEMEDIYHTAAARLLEENLHASAQPAGDDGVTVAGGAVNGDNAGAGRIDSAFSVDDGNDDENRFRGAAAGTRSSVTVRADVVTMMAAVLEMLKEDLQMKLTVVADLSLSTSAAHVSSYSMLWQLRPFVDERVIKEASRWANDVSGKGQHRGKFVNAHQARLAKIEAAKAKRAAAAAAAAGGPAANSASKSANSADV